MHALLCKISCVCIRLLQQSSEGLIVFKWQDSFLQISDHPRNHLTTIPFPAPCCTVCVELSNILSSFLSGYGAVLSLLSMATAAPVRLSRMQCSSSLLMTVCYLFQLLEYFLTAIVAIRTWIPSTPPVLRNCLPLFASLDSTFPGRVVVSDHSARSMLLLLPSLFLCVCLCYDMLILNICPEYMLSIFGVSARSPLLPHKPSRPYLFHPWLSTRCSFFISFPTLDFLCCFDQCCVRFPGQFLLHFIWPSDEFN